MENEKIFTFTVKDVAKTFKVTSDTVKRWIKAGKLQAIKIGRKYNITAESFAKAISVYSTAALTLKQFENIRTGSAKKTKAEVK